MADEAKQPPAAAGSSAATGFPPWVLLQHSSKEAAVGSISNDAAFRASSATAHTSTGHPIGVSLDLASPPAVSTLRVHLSHGFKNYGTLVTAHGDSLLIYVIFMPQGDHDDSKFDYFVYSAGAGTPRPPVLSLLPPVLIRSRGHPMRRRLDERATGLLRRGEDDEFAVAELKIVAAASEEGTPEKKQNQNQKVAELLLLHHGRWSVKRPRMTIHGEGERTVAQLLSSWTTKTVLPIGDTHLCWVDLYHGLLFCSVVNQNPVLRHVALPVEAKEMEPLSGPASTRSVCVTGDGGRTVKLVGVFPRCCCGETGSTHCRRSHYAYTVNTWTLRLETMAWVMDGMVDATELWASDAYQGLPRVPLSCPLVSMEDPHTICFSLCEWFHDKQGCDKTQWLLLVDIRRKSILSVDCHSDELGRLAYRQLHPSMVSSYLDPNPSSRNDASSSKEGYVDMIPSLPMDVVDEPRQNDARGNSARPSLESSPKPGMEAQAIFAGFQEIPSYGLDHEDMLKAYNILSLDNGRCLTSLLGIPKNMRRIGY